MEPEEAGPGYLRVWGEQPAAFCVDFKSHKESLAGLSLHLPQTNSPDPFLKIALCLPFKSHIGSWAHARVF